MIDLCLSIVSVRHAVHNQSIERQLVTLYLVDIHFEHGTLAGMEVIGIETEDNITDDEDGDNDDDEPEVILGGNILNLLLLLLEGPQQQTTILEHRPRRF